MIIINPMTDKEQKKISVQDVTSCPLNMEEVR